MSTPETKRLCLRVWNRSSSGGTRPPLMISVIVNRCYPSNIFLMPARGDSMTPTLKNQALIMVNRIEDFASDGIYVFRFDGQLMW
ncbi:S24 family peptidase [Vibrio splendidus]|uniref:S24 family peptidase n=1 Tax=Vibrio splendidus TaxID=29497 RepID=UPI0030B8CF8A